MPTTLTSRQPTRPGKPLRRWSYYDPRRKVRLRVDCHSRSEARGLIKKHLKSPLPPASECWLTDVTHLKEFLTGEEEQQRTEDGDGVRVPEGVG